MMRRVHSLPNYSETGLTFVRRRLKSDHSGLGSGRSRRANNCLTHRSKVGKLCGPFNPRFDFAAEYLEVAARPLSAVMNSLRY